VSKRLLPSTLAILLCVAAWGLDQVPGAQARVRTIQGPGFATPEQAVLAGVLEPTVLRQLRVDGEVTAIVNLRYQQALADAEALAPSVPVKSGWSRQAPADRSAALPAAVEPVFRAEKQRVFEAIAGVTVTRDYAVLPAAAVSFTDEDALLDVLNAQEVLGVGANRTYRVALTQSLPLIGQQPVYQLGYTGKGTAVAVLDSGVDFTRKAFGACDHPGGSCKVAYSADFGESDGLRDAFPFHGTNVAGIVAGVAPRARILALDVVGLSGAEDADILDAIDWTIANQATYGTKAINLSLALSGGPYYEGICPKSTYAGPFEIARATGILPVLASGNGASRHGSYADGVAWPACTQGAVRVGAVYDSDIGPFRAAGCRDGSTAADEIGCFSQGGPLLSLLAPGARVSAARITMSGTSQAAPMVSGGVAALASAAPTASVGQIQAALSATGPTIFDARSGLPSHRLSLPAAATALRGPDSALVIDDVARYELDSGTDPFVFTVTLLAPTASPVTVDYATSDGTAKAPGAYTPTSGTLSFAPGETEKTITVNVVGDPAIEPNQTFTVGLSDPSGAILTEASGTGTIVDDDSGVPQETSTSGILQGTHGYSGKYGLYDFGDKVRYLVTVSPDLTGRTVTVFLKKRKDHKWVGVQPRDQALGSGSTLLATWDSLAEGDWKIKAEYAGSSSPPSYYASQSAWSYFQITK
jgi:hypothetical protein